MNAIPMACPNCRMIFDKPVACAKSFPRKPHNAIDMSGTIKNALPKPNKMNGQKKFFSLESGDENERSIKKAENIIMPIIPVMV